jgi:hypothetical protein
MDGRTGSGSLPRTPQPGRRRVVNIARGRTIVPIGEMGSVVRGGSVAAVAFALTAVSCAGGTQEVANTSVSGPESTVAASDRAAEAGDGDARPGWTVLVYSMADTDLEPFLLDDITEMGAVGSGDNFDMVALVDRASGYSDDPVLGLDDWEGAKLLHVVGDQADVLDDLGDVNTGDPAVLADFIAEGIARFPAEKYALVLSDHGAAWPGVGGDESSDHDVLNLAEISAAIAEGLDRAGVDRLELLGFDACLMATYEVASTVAPFARRLLSSQELEPGHGWDYRVLQMLRDSPETDVDMLGRALVDGFRGQAISEGTEAEITLSLVDLEAMPALDTALAAFTDSLTSRAGALGSIIGRTRATTLGFGRQPDPTEDTHMVDLGMLVAEIGNDALDVSSEADEVLRTLNQIVTYSVAGAAAKGATGLSIYFPPQQQWFSQDYTDVVAASGWAGFLAAYYAGGAAIPSRSRAAFASDVAEVFFDDDGLNIIGRFDAAAADNVVEATIQYGIVDADGSVIILGREPASIADDGSGAVIGTFDLRTLTIDDGEDSAAAFIDLRVDEDAGVITIDVPLLYYPPGAADKGVKEVLLSIVVDLDWNVLSETYYVYDNRTGTFGELTANPNGIIVPEVLVVGANGDTEWLATTDAGLYANLPGLDYLFDKLPSGTVLYIELSVTDFGGNTASVNATVTIP